MAAGTPNMALPGQPTEALIGIPPLLATALLSIALVNLSGEAADAVASIGGILVTAVLLTWTQRRDVLRQRGISVPTSDSGYVDMVPGSWATISLVTVQGGLTLWLVDAFASFVDPCSL